ncbi:PAS domain-containing sensor histidine kinase [Sphingopyxis sp. H038]|uniref:two-component system sensor histidine kinase NtrB n=1 Tax=unclassified Sphingopyxis TaxID=2614943 RepID=UPI00073078DF|nr:MULTISPECIES: ATP-binding protein [unclassified Sphingopyxis]KTE02981.1 PAS domain-containing sensor histidine kinase [Sphingopyxis sp. H012]KTE10358.1 PAS domain-containing sensor histidine kinase [Sphingopyxis sp. H053]KTE14716.1 PAS domain-containing sensor histidine kinase [Sphingopyxis sp. H093]KTE28964.1 PAS domain-containing sensor histidine kinase [Sphingopyxis sp. H080]KTE35962.1 PAS domain-containing sensor histidine kinase [Sphingopyxis sp. H038]
MTTLTSSIPSFDHDELIQSHPVPTLLIDGGGVVLFVNAAAEQLCNVSRSAMVGRVVYDVIEMDRSYRQRMSDASTSALFAHRTEISAGGRRSFFVDMQMVPYGQSGHRILALVPSQSDAELMGGAIGRSGRAAGAAASMLAHEIKNPLAGIKGAAQLLARKTDAGGERFTTLICAEVDRIATLIDQMEHFSRGQPMACGPINLYQPIHQAMETARARQFPGIRFAEDFDPSLPLVHGNHDAMVQILLNLVTNGCEALCGRDDGVVRLTTAYRHGLSIDNGDGRGRIALPIEVSVSDNGPGVPADIRGDLFAPFVTTKREGRGLGLALVAKLARDMGGTVQHIRDGEWTRFRVHLPVAQKGRPA